VKFDRELARQLWAATQSETRAQTKGELLELTVAYLFVTLAGFDVRLRVTGLDSEFDLLMRARDPDDTLVREIGSYVLVECKNTAAKTSASEVRNFSAKVRYASCRTGVLVARQGLTGNRGPSVGAAAYAVRKTYHRDGLILLLLDGNDIEAVVERRVDFHDLLVQRYEEIRFDLATV
jgi:hypothetical protein